MKCPHTGCGYNHTQESGRLLLVKPTYGLVKMKGEGVSTHPLFPEHYLAKERWQEVKNGNLYECGSCGRPFAVNSEGAWTLPMPQQTPQQQTRRNGPTPEEKPQRPPHLLDEDAAPEPSFG